MAGDPCAGVLKRLVLSNTAAHLEPAAYFDDLVAQTLASHDLEAMADMFTGNWFPAEMFDSRPQTIAEFRVKLQMLQGVHMLNVERSDAFVPAVSGFLLESQRQPRNLDVLARGAMLPSHADEMG